MSIGSIRDASIKLRPSKDMLKFIQANAKNTTDAPDNLVKVLNTNGFGLFSNCSVLETGTLANNNDLQINTELLEALCDQPKNKKIDTPPIERNHNTNNNPSSQVPSKDVFNLNDLRWLAAHLAQLRKCGLTEFFLHDLLEMSSLQLPENDIIKRNPELEARCKKLREQQLNQAYRKMTKDVDATIKNAPEDTIAYQMKAINSQIIAVLQFVFSVLAGFVFGFLGIQLIVGNLDFGFRLLLGIIFALIIALAEIYFLAKKLNEYDVIPDLNEMVKKSTSRKPKQHVD